MLKKTIKLFTPPDAWKFPVIVLVAIFLGLAAFTFHLSKATSYLSDDPKTCVNCHIMGPQYATWSHSSHREVASCNECHVPQDNVFNHYFFKAKDGMRHATMFTLRLEPQVIFIKDAGKAVVQDNCVRCHTRAIEDVKVQILACTVKHEREGRTCWECHREVPHGKVRSLSSTPFARVPTPESAVPEWLKDALK